MRTVINNPDIKKEFPVWYFCLTCHKTWKADKMNDAVEHIAYKHHHLGIRTVSTDKPFIIVGEDFV